VRAAKNGQRQRPIAEVLGCICLDNPSWEELQGGMDWLQREER
jgi:hypothetical protein